MFIASALLICFISNAYGDLVDVDQSKLNILLYTPQNPDVPIPLQTANLSEIAITVTNQVKYIMHGWNDNANSAWVTNMKNAYIQQGHVVIFMDWSYYSTSVVYPMVIPFVQGVGKVIGGLVMNLNEIFGVALSLVECIGHSLGAHGCGYAGKNVIQTIAQKIGNITGLDPAGPGYEGVHAALRLDKTDADIVKVLHTNAGGEGIIQTIGKVDFFPNGGSLQSNCLIVDTNCSHYASVTYWINGINSNQYVGRQCSSYATLGLCRDNPTAIMGEGTDASASGVYYLKI